MRQNYVKNAAVLTGSGLVLRLAGMLFRVYLAGALGSEGLGLYQLILAFYSVFITLATSGVSVAATRLVAEELGRSMAAARAVVRRLCAVALALGCAAGAAQFGLAGLAARWWLGDTRATASIRTLAFSLPFMALAAVLRGAFLALRRVGPNVVSQLVEQGFRIAAVFWLLQKLQGAEVALRCQAVLLGETTSEMLSTGLMMMFYRRECCRMPTEPGKVPADINGRIWQILWPVEGGRCLSSGLHTAENMLVPACLAVYLAADGGRTAAVAQYGVLKGMALPLLYFPFSLLGSLATLLMPEITEAHVKGHIRTLRTLLDRMLALTMYASALAGAAFWVCAAPLAELLYQSSEAAFYIRVLAPVMPLMYLENMVDGAIKGIGEQKAAFGYSAWDSTLRIAGVILLLPRMGMPGFLLVICGSNLFTCLLNTRRLLQVTGLPLRTGRWICAPALAAFASVTAGRTVLVGLAGQHPAVQLLAAAAAMGAVYLPVAWFLGLNEAAAGICKKKSKKIKKSVDKTV
ncbi:MAG: oligosaccharide flippase family protein [Faecalibacterium sp.]|nr:oligosaccharide flippase family protein [Faecalibacterium sp.]